MIKNLGRTLLDELENLFRSYWAHRLGVSDGFLQVLGHSVRVKTREIQGYQLQGSGHHVEASAYEPFPYTNIVTTSNLDCMYIMLQTKSRTHTSSNLICMYIMLQIIVEYTHTEYTK